MIIITTLNSISHSLSMALLSTIKVLERCKVSPCSSQPPNSSPLPPQTTTTTIPLTFFDLPWLFISPNQPLFFYEYHHPTSHFFSHSLPTLKHTLSLTLQLFFPFSYHLSLPPPPHKPHFLSTQNDHVSLTVAESTAAEDFHLLTQYHPREVSHFHSLVPHLKTSVSGPKRDLPLLSIQITVFPSSGFCLGFAYHHVAADLRTFNSFIKTWSSLCRDSRDGHHGPLMIKTLPSFDRTVIVDRHGLEEVFLNEWFRRKCKREEEKMVVGSETEEDFSGMVRATFVVRSTHMDPIKKWIVTQCMKKYVAQPVHLSPYVLTCSFVWVCLAKTMFQKSQNGTNFGEGPTYFGFNAGGVNRLDYLVPASYFGNCVGFGLSKAVRDELLGEDGIVVAAHALGNTIKTLDKDLFGGAERWISDWEVMVGSDAHVMVSGSPKVDLYKTDFGWGRPKKIEEVSIDKKRGFSLTESRDFEGGIEVGLVLPKIHMDAFVSHFNQGLKLLHPV